MKKALPKRIEKHEETGTLANLIAHTTALSPQSLKHSYIKREQSEMYNLHDRPRASNIEFGEEGLLQIDFAENFVYEAQDEVQSAHWNQRQLTLFTSFLCHNEVFQSKVFVSDNLSHTKDTIIPYLFKLLSKLPLSLKVLKIWSDGPSSQFKNRYIASIIHKLETEFGLKIVWNYFATSHGKGCVDGIGATTKITVRRQIKARKCIVNNASDFVKAFNLISFKVTVEETTKDKFVEINDFLGVAEIFSNAKNVRNIASAHQIQFVPGKIVTNETSKQGYN